MVERAVRLWELFLVEYAELANSYADLDATAIDTQLPRDLVVACERALVAQRRWPAHLPLPEVLR